MKTATSLIVGVLGLWITLILTAPAQTPVSAKDALQAFNDLVGDWRGTGTPAGPREEQLKGFWSETIACEWQFKGGDAWLKLTFDKSKNFTSGELRYLPDKKEYQLTVRNLAKEPLAFTGPLKDRTLTVERQTKVETQRLVFSFLHANRFLYRFDVKPAAKNLFTKIYQVGATKEGVPFASGDGKPECVVSGGGGTMPVTFQGKTYYVCCSGCRTEFNESPAKYVREYEEKQKKKAKNK